MPACQQGGEIFSSAFCFIFVFSSRRLIEIKIFTNIECFSLLDSGTRTLRTYDVLPGVNVLPPAAATRRGWRLVGRRIPVLLFTGQFGQFKKFIFHFGREYDLILYYATQLAADVPHHEALRNPIFHSRLGTVFR